MFDGTAQCLVCETLSSAPALKNKEKGKEQPCGQNGASNKENPGRCGQRWVQARPYQAFGIEARVLVLLEGSGLTETTLGFYVAQSFDLF